MFGDRVYRLVQCQKSSCQSSKRGSPRAKVETDVEGHAVIRGGVDEYALTLPVILEVGKMLSNTIRKEKQGTTFIEDMIPKMRHALYQDLGVRFPGVHVRTDSPTFEPDEYSIYLNEVPIVRGKIIENALLTNENPENSAPLQHSLHHHEKYHRPALCLGRCKNTRRSCKKQASNSGTSRCDDPPPLLFLPPVCQRIHRHPRSARHFRVRRKIVSPTSIKEVTRLVPLQKLTEIFKRLVQEQISIKDLRTILEALSEWAQTEKDTVLLTEYVRSSLKRYISYKYSQGQSVLSVYLLDPEIEDMVRGAIKQTSAGSYLALDPDSVQLILHAMRTTIVPTPVGGQPPVLLTAIDVRRFVRKLIEGEFPDMAVVSYQEIVPEIRIQPLGASNFLERYQFLKFIGAAKLFQALTFVISISVIQCREELSLLPVSNLHSSIPHERSKQLPDKQPVE